MANPPISIPPFNNVPAPGSPIQSAWAQQLTTYAVAGARGWIGSARSTVSTTPITATVIDIAETAVTFTADPTRRYLTLAHVFRLDQFTASGLATVTISNQSNATLSSAAQTIPANAMAQAFAMHVESGLSGSQTRKLRASVSAGTMTCQASAQLIVLDIGKA